MGDTITFLFTAIEGSTRIGQPDPDAMRAAVALSIVIQCECLRAARATT